MGNGASLADKVLAENDKAEAVRHYYDMYKKNPAFWDEVFRECRLIYDREEAMGVDHHQSHNTLRSFHGHEGKHRVTVDHSNENSVNVKATAPSYLLSMNCLSISKEICDEINRVRRDPKSYADNLQMLYDSYIDEYLFRSSSGELVQSKEGRALVQETIAFLRNQTSMHELEVSDLLEKAAIYHANDLHCNNLTGHESSNGLTVKDRIEMFASWTGSIGENIDFINTSHEIDFNSHDNIAHDNQSMKKIAREIVIDLLVDDGVPGRGHRINVMKEDFHCVGAALTQHGSFKFCCVMDFAANVVSKASVLTEDTSYTITSLNDLGSPMFERLLVSIPFEGDLRTELATELKPNSQIVIDYQFISKLAKISYIEDNKTRVQTIQWSR